MNRPLVGWIILWSGLLLTAISARHATAYFADGPELAAIHGGDPTPINDGNGWCAVVECSCDSNPGPGCWHHIPSNTCQLCVAPEGETLAYLCCKNRGLGAQYDCNNSLNTAQCGRITSVPANPNAPFCVDINGNGICSDQLLGLEPACVTYQVVDGNSDPCPP